MRRTTKSAALVTVLSVVLAAASSYALPSEEAYKKIWRAKMEYHCKWVQKMRFSTRGPDDKTHYLYATAYNTIYRKEDSTFMRWRDRPRNKENTDESIRIFKKWNKLYEYKKDAFGGADETPEQAAKLRRLATGNVLIQHGPGRMFHGHRLTPWMEWRCASLFNDVPSAQIPAMLSGARSKKKGYRIATSPDYSIAHPESLPMKYRIWAGSREDDTIPYCGMIDDDVMYDFRKSNPFDSVLTQNKEGIFLYVYDFDRYRKHSIDWVIHDRLAYGHEGTYDEDMINEAVLKAVGRKEKDFARITYPKLVENINDPLLRLLRARIFTRLYLAKLRTAKLLHPAPEWHLYDYNIDEIEDRPSYYADNIGRRGNNNPLQKWLDKVFDPCVDLPLEQGIAKARRYFMTHPIYEYWDFVEGSMVRVFSAEGNYFNYTQSKGDQWRYNRSKRKIQRISKAFNIREALLAMYQYMSVKSPNKATKDLDFRAYYPRARKRNYISVALWAGSAAAGPRRHYAPYSIKTFFPYFEFEKEPGRCGWQNPRTGYTETTVTGGLVYAGFGRVHNINVRKHWGTHKRAYKEALEGPFMTISSRTLKKYGKEYFERLAGHPLIVVNVTGAMLESSGRIQLTPDYDYYQAIMDMDYFYVKDNAGQNLGRKTQRTVRPYRARKTRPWRRNFHGKRNIPNTAWLMQFVKKYEYNVDARKPRFIQSERGFIQYLKRTKKNWREYLQVYRDIQRSYKKDRRVFPNMQFLRAHRYPQWNKQARNGEAYFFDYFMTKKERRFGFRNRHQYPPPKGRWQPNYKHGVEVFKMIGYRPHIIRSFSKRFKKFQKMLRNGTNTFDMHRYFRKYISKERGSLVHFAGNPYLYNTYYKHRKFLINTYSKDFYDSEFNGGVAYPDTGRDGFFLVDGGESSALDSSVYAEAHQRHGSALVEFIIGKARINGRSGIFANSILRKNKFKDDPNTRRLKLYATQGAFITERPNWVRDLHKCSQANVTYFMNRNLAGKVTYTRNQETMMYSAATSRATVEECMYMFPDFYTLLEHTFSMGLTYYRNSLNYKYQDDTDADGNRIPFYSNGYEPQTMTYISVLRHRKGDKIFKPSKASRREIERLTWANLAYKRRSLLVLPTKGLEFVVTDGIPIPQLRRASRVRVVYALNKTNRRLFEGLERVK